MKAVTNKVETWVDGEGGGGFSTRNHLCEKEKEKTHSWSLMLEWDIYTMI